MSRTGVPQFGQMLKSGRGREHRPIGWDHQYGVPVVDAQRSMVTPSRPLWFIQQASAVGAVGLPGYQSYGPRTAAPHRCKACRAVTIERPQHGLQKWVRISQAWQGGRFRRPGGQSVDGGAGQGRRDPVVNTCLGGKSTAK